MPKPEKFLLKIFYKNGTVKRIQRISKRRLSASIQANKKLEVEKYHITVTYCSITNSNNKKIKPINKGEYKTKNELVHALKCFTEK